MTELLYQTDSYLREFDATVVAVDAAGGRVALDRTAFYPGGGGQPGDLGTQTFRVSETLKVCAINFGWNREAPRPNGEELFLFFRL